MEKVDILTEEQAEQVLCDLYKRGHGIAVYVIRRILGNQLTNREVEKLVQEGFLRMLIHREHLSEIESDRQLSYLTSTMRNVAIEESRRRMAEQ